MKKGEWYDVTQPAIVGFEGERDQKLKKAAETDSPLEILERKAALPTPWI